MYIISLIGLAAFAASGVLASKDKKPDFIGGIILAYVTALGGGICRDAILGQPAQSFKDINNFIVIFVAAIISMIFLKQIEKWNKQLDFFYAIGLGLFNAGGFLMGINHIEFPDISAVVLGAVTGVGGGVTRDILCNRMPYILKPGELYITPCIIGGFVGLLAINLNFSNEIVLLIISAITILVRLLSVKYKWSFPTYYKNS